jgi:hypothetical protein
VGAALGGVTLDRGAALLQHQIVNRPRDLDAVPLRHARSAGRLRILDDATGGYVGANMHRSSFVAAAALLLAACATPYTESGILGGFDAKEFREDVYRVSFGGNGYTSTETVQTYWLYKCADLALEKGYYGFEILSDLRFVMHRPESQEAVSGTMRIVVSAAELAELSRWRIDASHEPDTAVRVQVARGGTFIYVPTYGGAARPKPLFQGDIQLIKKTFAPAPPKLFAASALKGALEDHVKSDKCGLGNVCPHVHDYLFPKGALQPR